MGGRDLGATGLLITLVLFQDPPVPLATSCLALGLQSSVLGLGVGTRETGWGGGTGLCLRSPGYIEETG